MLNLINNHDKWLVVISKPNQYQKSAKLLKFTLDLQLARFVSVTNILWL